MMMVIKIKALTVIDEQREHGKRAGQIEMARFDVELGNAVVLRGFRLMATEGSSIELLPPDYYVANRKGFIITDATLHQHVIEKAREVYRMFGGEHAKG
jgi:hypothetical protein